MLLASTAAASTIAWAFPSREVSEGFAKPKTLLRRAEARTSKVLIEALARALEAAIGAMHGASSSIAVTARWLNRYDKHSNPVRLASTPFVHQCRQIRVSFGKKHLRLVGSGDDPAFRAALEGVETIVRNSDAHSEVYFLQDGARFVQTNFRARTKEEKIYTDEELSRLLADLTRTVLGLSNAPQLFQADNIREISSGLVSVETPEGLRVLYLELFLGATGLLESKVSKEETLLTTCAECLPTSHQLLSSTT